MVHKYASSTSSIFLQVYSDGNVYAGVSNGSTAYGSVVASGTDWIHYVMVFDGAQSGNANRLKLYVNGVQQTLTFSGTIPSTTPSTSANVAVGQNPGNSVYNTGSIDELSLYDTPLTAADALLLYNVGSERYGRSSDTGLVAGWHFDEDSGTSAADYSGNSNTGTLANGPTWTTGKVVQNGVVRPRPQTGGNLNDSGPATVAVMAAGAAAGAAWVRRRLKKG